MLTLFVILGIIWAASGPIPGRDAYVRRLPRPPFETKQ